MRHTKWFDLGVCVCMLSTGWGVNGIRKLTLMFNWETIIKRNYVFRLVDGQIQWSNSKWAIPDGGATQTDCQSAAFNLSLALINCTENLHTISCVAKSIVTNQPISNGRHRFMRIHTYTQTHSHAITKSFCDKPNIDDLIEPTEKKTTKILDSKIN